jgi:DNA ligase D-like protein (predicted ligase)
MAPMPPRLPDDLKPMLCRIGKPFDSPQHLFECKWDGVRALAFVEQDSLRLHSRHRRDLATRYPELAGLGTLPAGTLLDGELVVLRADGSPDFPAILRRENARQRARVAKLAQELPVVYVVFDLLYRSYEPLLEQPLHARRGRLQELVERAGNPRLVLSQGVVGQGLQLFAAVRERGLEGVIAKRLDSRYRPGERTDAWQKIKPVQVVHCAILGYEEDVQGGLKSLVIATDVDGELRCVGRVGSGLSVADRERLWPLLQARRRSTPWLAADVPGIWVEPGLYCQVSFLERTASGSLRAPVFLQWSEG